MQLNQPYYPLSFLKQWEAVYRSYAEPFQISKMESLMKKANGFQPQAIFAKHSILDVWKGSDYASGLLTMLWCGSKRDT